MEQKQSCGQNIVAKLDGSSADSAEIKERVLETVNDEWAEEDDNDMVMMMMMMDDDDDDDDDDDQGKGLGN